ncbi:hypothetical protein CR513_09413, partial [Mucuna pruriens]
MGESSEEIKFLSPKTKLMVKQMKRLKAKLGEILERMENENKEGLDSITRDTQSINVKVEALHRKREREREENKEPSIHESEASHGGGYVNGYWYSISHKIHRHGDYKRLERHERHRRRREESKRDDLQSVKCRDLYAKLQRLCQGSKSVEDYHKNMELVMIRAQIAESQEATMARFLHGLNREIQDIVELHYYNTLEDLVHQDKKVELQLKRKLSSRKSYLSSSWKGKEKGEDRPRKDKSPKKGNEPLSDRKEEKVTPPLSSSRSSSIKCFNSDHSYDEDDLVMARRVIGMRQSMKEFRNSIHREQALVFHILRPFTSPKDASALVPRDQLPCANVLFPKAYLISLHAIFKSFELYGVISSSKELGFPKRATMVLKSLTKRQAKVSQPIKRSLSPGEAVPATPAPSQTGRLPSPTAESHPYSFTLHLLSLASNFTVVHSALALRLSWLRRCRSGTGKLKSKTESSLTPSRPYETESSPTLLRPSLRLAEVVLSRDRVGSVYSKTRSDYSANISAKSEQMENNDQTLKELATPDVVYQP